MKKELQDCLFEKYPLIFIQKSLTPQETAMCRGIACNDGWYNLLDVLCGNIQNHLQNLNRGKVADQQLVCEAVQVKEKYGGLRFYITGGDDYIKGLIGMTESMSYKTCSVCGNKSNPSKGRGWIYTLCSHCKKKKYEK